jgi:formylglycine-generating enzyme required for sulfatase activity
MNHSISILDAIDLLGYLFQNYPEELDCEAAADWNDDGQVDIGDVLSNLFYLFEAEAPPAQPYPLCGKDPTPSLPCDHYWFCGTGDLSNGYGMRFLPVPSGTFQMGSPPSEPGRSSDELLHTVRFTCDFYMSENEVTQAQYIAIMGDNPSWFNGIQRNNLEVSDYGQDLNRPVEMVSWLDAREFCRRLSEEEHRKYRLPYEAEWEYACRAGTKTRLWFGDMLQCVGSGSCPDATPFMWTCSGDLFGITPVALKAPNPWGFYDIAGHVAEWCQDWYGPYPIGPVVDPTGPPDGINRVLRGTACPPLGLDWARSAKRLKSWPDGKASNSGFRVVLELPACHYGD